MAYKPYQASHQNGGVNNNNSNLKYSKLMQGNTTDKMLGSQLKPATAGLSAVGTVSVAAKPSTPTFQTMSAYENLLTPGQLRQNANQFAQNKFQNEQLGHNQMIDRYQQQIGQLQSNKDIRSEAERMAQLKYADAILDIQEAKRNSQLQAQLGIRNARSNYDDSTKKLDDLATNQQSQARVNLAGRGLYNSSLLDQMNTRISGQRMESQGELEKSLNDSLFQIDAELSNLLANFDARGASLTQRQQEEMVARMDELTRERNNKQDQFNMLIDQQYQNINQARNNMVTNAEQLYQQLFNQNQGIYDSRKQSAERQAMEREQMALQERLQQQQIAATDARAALDRDFQREQWGAKAAQEAQENSLGSWGIRDLQSSENARNIQQYGDIDAEVLRAYKEFGLNNQQAEEYRQALVQQYSPTFQDRPSDSTYIGPDGKVNQKKPNNGTNYLSMLGMLNPVTALPTLGTQLYKRFFN